MEPAPRLRLLPELLLALLGLCPFGVGCSAPARPERPEAPRSAAGEEESGARAAPLGGAPAGALEIGDPYFPGLGNGGYDVEHYDLELAVDMAADELVARALLQARALQDLGSFSLDLYGLEVESVLVDGRLARFERPAPQALEGQPRAKPSELVVHPSVDLQQGAAFSVEIRYGGSPDVRPDPSVPFAGVGWARKESGVYVVSECIGASSWFPCNDHPRDKASYSFRITVERPYVAAANGLLQEIVEDGERRVFVFEARDPMASYLATVNIAEFGVFEERGPRGIPVRTYHPLDASEEELAPFRRQSEILEHLEGLFGPYPFESAGAVLSYENIGGALECQTLPVYGRGCGTEVIVHELAHQWYGDCVSPDLWRDMWLNEGFATYAGWLWSEHEGGQAAYEDTVRRAYRSLRKGKVGPPYDPGVASVFSQRVYTRGAMVLAGLRREVGDEAFFRILRGWVEEHHDGNGSTNGFMAYAAAVSGRDLTAFFEAWLLGAVTPEVPDLEEAEAPTPGGE